jgi:hypothetical protein
MFPPGFALFPRRQRRSHQQAGQGRCQPRATFRPGVEPLEERLAPSISVTPLGTNASNAAADTSISATISAGALVGDTILIAFAMDPTSGPVSATDTAGNTYTPDTDVANGSGTTGVRSVIFHASVAAGKTLSAGNSITVNYPSTTAKALSVFKATNLAISSVDRSTTGIGSNTSVSSGTTAMTSQASELLFGDVGQERKNDSFTPAAGYTQTGTADTNSGAPDSNITVFPAYRTVSTAATYSLTGSLGNATNWSAALVTYKALAAPHVSSMSLPDANPTNAATLHFTVNFDESVSTVTTSNFTLVTTSSAAGSITGISGSGAGPYTITVTSVTGNGTLALRMANSTGVTNSNGDGVSNLPFTSSTYTVDHTAPFSSIVFPASSGNYNTAGWTGSITGTASDSGGSGLAGVGVSVKRGSDNLYWNGSSYGSATEVFNSATGTSSWSYGFPASNLASGVSYIVRSRASDNAGNAQVTPAAAGFLYDTAAPTAVITFPVNNAVYNSSTWTAGIPIKGTTSDVGGSGVASDQVSIRNNSTGLYWNGSSFTNASETWLNAPGTASWSYSGTPQAGALTSGVTYTVHARATDNAGNLQTTVASNTFTFNLTGLVSTITFPANGAIYNTAGWTNSITGTANAATGQTVSSEKVSIQRLSDNLYWTGSAFSSPSEVLLGATNTGTNFSTWSFSFSSANLTSDVSYTVHAVATDTVNTTESPGPFATFTFDTTSPTVTSITLPGSNPTNATSVTYRVNFSESVSTVSTSNFNLVTTGAVSGSITGVTGSGAGPYTVTATSVSGNGTMALRMANSTGVTDSGGNGVSNVPFTSSAYTIDQTAPVAVIGTTPPNPDTNHSPTFTFSASDPTVGGVSSGVNHLETRLDGGSFSTATGPQTLSAVTDGSHTFYVCAVDNAGNVSSAVSYTWFIETVSDVKVHWGTAGSASIFSVTSNLPWYHVKTIDIVFASDVSGNISQSSLALTGVNVANYNIGNSGSASFSYNAGTKTATWTLSSAINIDRLMMSLSGGIYTKSFNVLPGDVNNDGVVNSQDLVLIQQHFTSSVAYNALYDIDGDGVVDINDYTLLRSFIGNTLP